MILIFPLAVAAMSFGCLLVGGLAAFSRLEADHEIAALERES